MPFDVVLDLSSAQGWFALLSEAPFVALTPEPFVGELLTKGALA